MSEKIYAYLLRLFPSAFRRHYEEEALRLLRDRLSNERGFFRRLRLGFDLIMDMIGALPQAYRNSYAEVAAVASAASHIDGIPSFQSLRNEPIRREALVVAGILTLTALVAFGHVMEFPIPYPAAQPNGRKSPIEMVLERLNKPSSPDSEENARSDNPQSVSTAVSRQEDRQITTTNTAPSPGARTAPNAEGETLAPGKQSRTASTFDYGPSRAVTSPSSPVVRGSQLVQSQAEAGPVGARGLSPTSTQALVAVTTNLSGKWTESLPADGRDPDVPHLFIFDQRSAVLSGTGGPDFTNQYPIIHGSVSGDYARFELNHERKSFLYDLKVEGEELLGTLSIRSANGTRRVTVSLERAH